MIPKSGIRFSEKIMLKQKLGEAFRLTECGAENVVVPAGQPRPSRREFA
jgi:hypothetical protein